MFHPRKFLMTFLKIIDCEFRIPHLSGNFYFPLLLEIPPDFVKLACFSTYFTCFSFSPSLTMIAFMHHHTMHVQYYVQGCKSLSVVGGAIKGGYFIIFLGG